MCTPVLSRALSHVDSINSVQTKVIYEHISSISLAGDREQNPALQYATISVFQQVLSLAQGTSDPAVKCSGCSGWNHGDCSHGAAAGVRQGHVRLGSIRRFHMPRLEW